jgi:mRNA interferase HigB
MRRRVFLDGKKSQDLRAGKARSDIIGTKGDTGLRKGDVRVIFDIKGNNYRLMTHINFELQVVFLKWLGTHSEYDKVDFKKAKF